MGITVSAVYLSSVDVYLLQTPTESQNRWETWEYRIYGIAATERNGKKQMDGQIIGEHSYINSPRSLH